MGKSKRVLRCYHCGAILQDENPKEKGFISPEVLKKGDSIQIIYCDKCYESMKAFNKSVLDQDVDQEILKMLDDAVASDAFIIWVVDYFSFAGLLNPSILNKIKNLSVAIAACKTDLFPDKLSKEKIKEYIKERCAEQDFEPYTIAVIGKDLATNPTKFINDVQKYRKGHDVYVIGNASSGKSTLINELLKSYQNITKHQIKTYNYEHTDLKIKEIPLNKTTFLFELPGISQTTSVVSKVEKDVAKILIPKKKLKASSKSLASGDSLMIGSVAFFNIVKGKSQTYKFYSAEGVETKKVLTKNIENTVLENMKKKALRPVSERLISFLDYDLFEYTMENDGKLHDIAIEGIGWLSFVAKGQIIRVCGPKGVAIKEGYAKIR